jgi:hypothetical protein
MCRVALSKVHPQFVCHGLAGGTVSGTCDAIDIRRVVKRFGPFVAMHGVSLTVRDNEFFNIRAEPRLGGLSSNRAQDGSTFASQEDQGKA